jgi:hypothetical protein
MLTPELAALLVIGVLCFAGLAGAALYAQHSAFNRAFLQFQALLVPGAEEIREQLDTQKQAEELVEALTSGMDEGEDLEMSPYEHLSPLAREYMPNYAYVTSGVLEEPDDDVVKAMREDIAAHWAGEFAKDSESKGEVS